GVGILLTRPSLAVAEIRHLAGRLAAAPGALAVLAAVCALAAVAVVRLRGRSRTSRWRRAVRAALGEARRGLLARGCWPGVAVSSVAVLAGHLGTFLLAARAAGSSAPLAELLPLMVLALLAMALPLNVGGWGPREGVTAWAFGAAGLGAAQGLTVAVVYGVLTFAASLPGFTVLVGQWFAGLRRGTNPVRVVLDPHGRVPPQRRVFTDGSAPTLWVVAAASGRGQHGPVGGDSGAADRPVLAAAAVRGHHPQGGS
ncbi:lysylphosphatidylglycerol synthase domain-containing protein, partial [Streptomyces sp. MCAF7]